MLRAEVEQVKEIARGIVKEELAKAMADHEKKTAQKIPVAVTSKVAEKKKEKINVKL